MKILHIASLHNIVTNGVGIAVPQHIKAQQNYADVAFINIVDLKVPGIEKQISYVTDFSLKTLEEYDFIPDIVIFHEVYHIEFWKIAKQLSQRKIPYIVVPHGSVSLTAQSNKKLKKIVGNMLFFNQFFRSAIGVQFLTVHEMNNSISICQKKGGVGTNGISMPQKIKTSFSFEEVKGIYIGRLDPYIKGIDLLAQGVKQYRCVFERAKFHLSMYGPNILSFHSQITSLISQNDFHSVISLHDAITGDEKEHILLNSDIFIQTSRSEGMPMGILEALSYGLPCLVTRGTNLGEIIEKYDAGWVAENSVESIADKLRQAVNERHKWEIKSRNARQLIEENFMWDKVANDTLKWYYKLIMHSKRREESEIV